MDHFTRIIQLLSVGRGKDAEEIARDWIVKDPNEPAAFFWLARALINQSRHKEAIGVAQAGLELDAMDPDSHYILAEALYQAGRYRASRKALDAAIELEPDDANNLILLGYIQLQLDNRPKALEAANRALALDPNSTEALQLRASVLARMNQSEAADSDMQQVLAASAEDSGAHLTQGWNCLLGGSYRQAQTHFTEALRIDPNSKGARMGLMETFKNRSFVYRVLFSAIIWINKLPTMWQLALLGGILIFGDKLALAVLIITGSLFAAIVADNAFMLFILLIICKDALFNLVIALDPETRGALSDRELKGVKWSSLFLLGMIVFTFANFMSDLHGLLLRLSLACAILSDMVVTLHELNFPEHRREAFWAIIGITAAVALLSIASLFNPETFTLLRMTTLGSVLYYVRLNSLRRAE